MSGKRLAEAGRKGQILKDFNSQSEIWTLFQRLWDDWRCYSGESHDWINSAWSVRNGLKWNNTHQLIGCCGIGLWSMHGGFYASANEDVENEIAFKDIEFRELSNCLER